ncbi:Required for respiratory growth protein 9 mitochondrial [Neurospora sp. IMI 360204]|nr:Required for respiratory growth protein 9 mitochondrial [Neurospora sp. IMI 360204]
MSCSCNTAALRIFVRNVANIQVPSSQQVTPRALSGIHRSRTTSLPFHTRSLHTTRAARTDSTENQAEPPTATEKPKAPKLLFRKTNAPTNPDWMGEQPPRRRDLKPREFTKSRRNHEAPTVQDEGDDAESTKKKMRWKNLPEEERRELYAKGGKEMPDETERQAQKQERKQERQQQKLRESLEEPKKYNPSNPKREDWQHQKNALKEKFPEGWKPLKKLSPDALEGIRALHKQFPDEYTTEVLSNKFQVSPEAIRRILRSKWRPDPDEEIERQERWFKRGTQIWQRYAELGVKPPKKWREQGIRPNKHWKEGEEKTFKDRQIANVKLHRSLL